VLVRKLGAGGFGEVWEARGPGGFAVALKFIPLGERTGDTELRALEVMKGIRHPHLLGMFGAWQQDGLLIVAMELADGTLLDRLNAAQQQGLAGVPPAELGEYMRDAARGLDHLNAIHIQHRDVKPQNLLLVGGGVKVGDFGLAKLLQHTLSGHTGAYTPAYVAPEFLSGRTSSHSDQYALAVTYCQLRGGQLPFTGELARILTGHLMDPPDLTMLPEAERPAVARALAKDPAQRWASCRAFVEALAAAAPESSRSPVPTETHREGGSLRLLPLRDVRVLAGGRRRVEVRLERDGCPGAVVLKLEGLPEGVRAEEGSVAAGANLGRLTLRASADVAPGRWSVRLTARAGHVQAEGHFDVAVPRRFANSLGMQLALIPRGTFGMGSPETDTEVFDDEKPRHDVAITRPFYVGIHPVTVGQFRRFVEDTTFKDAKYVTEPERDGEGGWGYDEKTRRFEARDPRYNWKHSCWEEQTDQHPVVNVTWNDAVAFCDWLSRKEGRRYELPTEAEWEYACRAGSSTRYHFGDDPALLGEYAWYWENAGGRTHEVGTKKANAWGLFDMHGNVWQWCADGPRKYENGSVKNPKGPRDGRRVLRGGSWDYDLLDCRAACRYHNQASERSGHIGFRVVLRPGRGAP
jgi:formylglycine-generating enzyme required for sulfatase activity